MNWATIAPQSRLYKGKYLFRWEASPGLEHHCGVCQTPLHNARAKSTCIGRHVEPCYRFHQQLHFNGKSHECFGCKNSDEMHHRRHKEILTLVRRIVALDGQSSPDHEKNSIFISHDGLRRSSVVSAMTTTVTDTSSVFSAFSNATVDTSSSIDTCSDGFIEVAPKMRRSEFKKAKGLGMSPSSKRVKVEVFTKEDADFVSEAIHLEAHQPELLDTKPATAIVDEVDKVEGVTDEIAALSVRPIHSLAPRQRKILKKPNTPVKNRCSHGGSSKFSPESGAKTDPYFGLDPQIFFRLGVVIVNPPKDSSMRKDLVAKLVAVVKMDLSIMAQEQEEKEMREEGFWRWAGKTAYQYIMTRRRDYDWATGARIIAPKNDGCGGDLPATSTDDGMEKTDGALSAVTQQPTTSVTPKTSPVSPAGRKIKIFVKDDYCEDDLQFARAFLKSRGEGGILLPAYQPLGFKVMRIV